MKTTSWAGHVCLGAHTAFYQPKNKEQSLRSRSPGVVWTTPGTFSRMLSEFLESARKASHPVKIVLDELHHASSNEDLTLNAMVTCIVHATESYKNIQLIGSTATPCKSWFRLHGFGPFARTADWSTKEDQAKKETNLTKIKLTEEYSPEGMASHLLASLNRQPAHFCSLGFVPGPAEAYNRFPLLLKTPLILKILSGKSCRNRARLLKPIPN